MKTFIAFLVCALLMANAAPAQLGPQGPPPVFKIVTSTQPAKGLIVFRETRDITVPVEVERVVIKNGKRVTEKVTEYRTETQESVTQIDATKSRITTPDAKQLPIDEVWKRLKPNTVVVVSADSNLPAAAYLQALNPQTLVIVAGPPMKK